MNRPRSTPRRRGVVRPAGLASVRRTGAVRRRHAPHLPTERDNSHISIDTAGTATARAVPTLVDMCAYIVVAEDDPLQAELIRRYLERENHRVVVVHDGGAALTAVRKEPPDLLVLDLMLPHVDGLDVCRTLRSDSDLLILILTARSAEADLLAGLDMGADDYMTKPYSPRELAARVRTLLRRGGVDARPRKDPRLRVGALVLDPERREVTVGGRVVDFTRGEFELLLLMATDAGRVFSRRQILSHQYGKEQFLSSRAVDAHVMNIRRKIEEDPRRPRRLLTVYGVGYKLVDDSRPGSPAGLTGPGSGEGR